MRVFAALSALLIVVSCSTLSEQQYLPPEELSPVIHQYTSGKNDEEILSKLNETLINKKGDREQWWAKYSLALLLQNGRPEEACRMFTELSANPRFPLSHVAHVRRIEFCELSKESLPEAFNILKDTSEYWLKELKTIVGLKLAERTSSTAEHIYFLEEQSKLAVIPSEKTAPMLKAIELGRQLKDKALIQRLENRLHMIAPRFNPNPRSSDLLKVAYDYRRNREFESARKVYRKVFRDKKRRVEERVLALKGLRHSYKQENRREEYIQVTRDLASFSEKLVKRNSPLSLHQLNLDNQLILVRTLWTAGLTAESLSLLRAVVKKPVKGLNVAEAHWLLARIAEENGQFQMALNHNRDALATEHKGTALWERLYWQKAWNERKLKNFDNAIVDYSLLVETMSQSDLINKYKFWLAKTLKDARRIDEAEAIFEEIVESDILGFYGLLSHRELNKELEALTPSHTPLGRPSFVTEDQYRIMRWLYSVGEWTTLRHFLKRSASQTVLLRSKDNDRNMYLNWLAQSGAFTTLFQIAAIVPDKKKILIETPELLFPRPYLREVEEASQQSGVPSELIFSIMRQESAFDPYARSPVDAFGLLQLTHFTAEKVAKEKGLILANHEDLYRPQLNIPLGASFMRSLLRKFDNQMLISIASYNASEEAVLSWLKTRYFGDPLEFIEDIPYSETMNYIKLVLRNFIFYSRISSAGEHIAFPEWCLDGLHTLKTSSADLPVSK